MTWRSSMGYFDKYGLKGLENLVGHNIVKVEQTEERMIFTNDQGIRLIYEVEGDCCSYSYFHDIVGEEKLIENGPVVSVGEIELHPSTILDSPRDEVVRCYGYEIVTESPKWGEQTTVFSFRNDSNGYYGGDMYFAGLRSAEVPAAEVSA